MNENEKLDLMKKFKELNVAEYTTKYGDYYGLMFAGAEIATKELQKENAELKADNDARKFAMAMSEKVEKQLREENAELKKKCYKKAVKDYCELEKENAELRRKVEACKRYIEADKHLMELERESKE